MIPSESITVRSSNATLAGLAGVVPVAITMLSALMQRGLLSPSSTSIAFGPANRAVPVTMLTLLRASWLRTTSFSLLTTCCVRADRSAMVISSFIR